MAAATAGWAVAGDCGVPSCCDGTPCVPGKICGACRSPCRVVCEMKKITKTVWVVETKEICLSLPNCDGCDPGCGGCGKSCAGCAEPCGGCKDPCASLLQRRVVPPKCARTRCIKQLVKKEIACEVPVYKCIQGCGIGCEEGCMEVAPLASYLWITIAAVVLGGLYGSHLVRHSYLDQTRADREARARLCSKQTLGLLSQGEMPAVDALCKELGNAEGIRTRITVILPEGEVVGDTAEDPAHMDNHADRPEIREAIDGTSGVGHSMRFSNTTKEDRMYVAVAQCTDGSLAAVVRASILVTVINETVATMRRRILEACLLATALIAAVSWWVSRRISHPLEDMKEGAERFARGELRHRLSESGVEEIVSLSRAMNRMAEQPDERIRTITRQQNEQEAMLMSMDEGALVVLHGMTRLKRLENVRRDFVANVSHELGTPITAIRGFVETLLDGALDDREAARRFLQRVLKQAGRLEAMADDLLTLSQLEVEAADPQGEFKPWSVGSMLRAAMDVCERIASDRGVRIVLHCDEELSLHMDALLLERAVSNLLENAIKYTPPDTTVRVSAVREGDEVVIRVEDQGCGIEAKHLPRLFERFYRVDKARRRELGGTGLGLA